MRKFVLISKRSSNSVKDGNLLWSVIKCLTFSIPLANHDLKYIGFFPTFTTELCNNFNDKKCSMDFTVS